MKMNIYEESIHPNSLKMLILCLFICNIYALMCIEDRALRATCRHFFSDVEPQCCLASDYKNKSILPYNI